MSEIAFGEYNATAPIIGVPQAARTGMDTLKYMPGKENMNPWGFAMCTALRSVYPHELSTQELNANPHRSEFFFAMTKLSVSANDFLDLQQTSSREQKTSLATLWKNNLHEINTIMNRVPESEQNFYRDITHSYQKEIGFLEHYARATPLDQHQLIQYRQVMNAINIWHLSAGLFGSDQIRSMGLEQMIQNGEPVSFEGLTKKYSWMTSENPKTGSDRGFAALFQTVMGMQVIDDWNDQQSDKKINAPSLVNSPTPMNEKQMRALRDSYFKGAESFGLSKLLLFGIKEGYTRMKIMAREATHNDRMTEHRTLIGQEPIVNHGERKLKKPAEAARFALEMISGRPKIK